MFHLTLIWAVIKKDVDMWLGVIFDSPGNQKETGKRTSHIESFALLLRKR
jgi:hypothetical protein